MKHARSLVIVFLVGVVLGAGTSVGTQTVLQRLDAVYYAKYRFVSGDATLTAADTLIEGTFPLGQPIGTPTTITLPQASAVPVGKLYNVKNLNVGPLTVAPASGDAIDGNTSGFVLYNSFDSVTLYKNGPTTWSIQ
jgi:hypothetical protein